MSFALHCKQIFHPDISSILPPDELNIFSLKASEILDLSLKYEQCPAGHNVKRSVRRPRSTMCTKPGVGNKSLSSLMKQFSSGLTSLLVSLGEQIPLKQSPLSCIIQIRFVPLALTTRPSAVIKDTITQHSSFLCFFFFYFHFIEQVLNGKNVESGS